MVLAAMWGQRGHPTLARSQQNQGGGFMPVIKVIRVQTLVPQNPMGHCEYKISFSTCLCQVLSPLAKNLFHRAISESGVALTAGLVKKNTRPLAEVNSTLSNSCVLLPSLLTNLSCYGMQLTLSTVRACLKITARPSSASSEVIFCELCSLDT